MYIGNTALKLDIDDNWEEIKEPVLKVIDCNPEKQDGDDDVNRLLEDEDYLYRYDNNGNMTRREDRTNPTNYEEYICEKVGRPLPFS